jgi:hypothetical protein
MIYRNINNAIISYHLPISTQKKLSPNIYKYQKNQTSTQVINSHHLPTSTHTIILMDLPISKKSNINASN